MLFRSELCEVEDAELLLHATRRNEVRVVGRVSDGSDDVIVLQGGDLFACVRVPDLSASIVLASVRGTDRARGVFTHAVKSAEAVAA